LRFEQGDEVALRHDERSLGLVPPHPLCARSKS
jgi:hypothetical protein